MLFQAPEKYEIILHFQCFLGAVKGQIQIEKFSMSNEMPDLPQTISPHDGKNSVWEKKSPETTEDEDDIDLLNNDNVPENIGRKNIEVSKNFAKIRIENIKSKKGLHH